jgi:hypothetical protein
MSQEHIEQRGLSTIELCRIDRFLAELARPTLDDSPVAPATRTALVQIGIFVGGEASRKEIIERLWGRKRSLLRRMGALGDWGPLGPVA